MNCSNTYAFYEKKARSVHSRKCINGKITGCGNCVGYCRYEMHPGFLTRELRQEHDCVKKGCHYYVAKPHKQDKGSVSLYPTREILTCAQAQISDSDCIRFIRADRQAADHYTLYYITITKDTALLALKNSLQNQFSCHISFVDLSYDFEICEQIFLGA